MIVAKRTKGHNKTDKRAQQMKCKTKLCGYLWSDSFNLLACQFSVCGIYVVFVDMWYIQWEFQDPKMEVLYHIRP